MTDLTLDTLVKVTGDDRRSMHGGSGEWRKGRWRSVPLPLESGPPVAWSRKAGTT